MKKIALLGNPNTGKSSIFNLLTGLQQKVGNFAGVTVDVKSGLLTLKGESVKIIDFPGTYSIYPRSNEEKLVYEILSDAAHPSFPDATVVVVDASNFERNMLLFDQVYSMGLPISLVLNMSDVAAKKGLTLSLSALQKAYPNALIVEMNARVGLGKDRLLHAIEELCLKINSQNSCDYAFSFQQEDDFQRKDIFDRRQKIAAIAQEVIAQKEVKSPKRDALDRLFLHPVFGYLIFVVVLFIIFQSIFSLAEYPMDWIESGFHFLSNLAHDNLPTGLVNDLISNGIIPGLSGVIVFIPQIALLFFFLGILEETGYLSRVIFLMDRLMRPLGLNGRSVVPLMSSLACAIPGILSARMITNWKERMITIFVAPLMSCSARIPVYTILIALVIPEHKVFGFVSVQGLVLLGLYLLGLFSALFLAWFMKLFIKSDEKSYLLLELPRYKGPRWMNVLTMMIMKTKGFVFDAGKIILAISILLWGLASFGPKGEVHHLTAKDFQVVSSISNSELASLQLEASFIGIAGLKIEPILRPLGYDWKVGIALISSFAAREVFVGTLATIYSVEDDEENRRPLLEQMHTQTFSNGEKVFTFASGISLMVFYVYALQCMATVAVVRKETGSWSWPIAQLIVMGVLAYVLAFLTFQLLK